MKLEVGKKYKNEHKNEVEIIRKLKNEYTEYNYVGIEVDEDGDEWTFEYDEDGVCCEDGADLIVDTQKVEQNYKVGQIINHYLGRYRITAVYEDYVSCINLETSTQGIFTNCALEKECAIFEETKFEVGQVWESKDKLTKLTITEVSENGDFVEVRVNDSEKKVVHWGFTLRDSCYLLKNSISRFISSPSLVASKHVPSSTVSVQHEEPSKTSVEYDRDSYTRMLTSSLPTSTRKIGWDLD